MSYVRFGLMILSSTVVMFVLMYLNTYALDHVFFSETRSYMALLMGAVMAFVMMAFMFGMYERKGLNLAIMAGSVLVFGLSLWLVRSQITVSGESYMRAMIPHHSIAIMTSERAGITNPRVRKLAAEIEEAQRKEISEMRYLVGALSEDEAPAAVFQDPPARVGTVEDARSNMLISQLDLVSLSEDEAREAVGATANCHFTRSPEQDPILITGENGAAAVKMNGVILSLPPAEQGAKGQFAAQGAQITIRALGEAADWRSNADLVLTLDQGPTIGYRGFYNCAA